MRYELFIAMTCNLFTVFMLLLSTSLKTFGDCGPSACPNVVTKTEWGARSATHVVYSVFPIRFVIIHHTVTPTCFGRFACAELLTKIQNFHMDDLHLDDIAYNFMVGGDGKIYQGRGWHKMGAHTKGYNSKAVAIAFLGNFTKKLPTDDQLDAAQELIKCGVKLGELDENYRLYGARQLSATQSPGLRLYKEIQSWRHFTPTNV